MVRVNVSSTAHGRYRTILLTTISLSFINFINFVHIENVVVKIFRLQLALAVAVLYMLTYAVSQVKVGHFNF